MDFKYSTVFANNCQIKALSATEEQKTALASFKDSIAIDLNENGDLLGISFEAALANCVNANDDGMSGNNLIDIAKNFLFKPINCDHHRKMTTGFITGYSFTRYGSRELITEEEARGTKEKFCISLTGVIWRLVNKDLASLIEETSEIFASWEIGFSNNNLILLPKDKADYKDGIVVTPEDKDFDKISDCLRANGGNGVWNEFRVCRDIVLPALPLGIGLTENPAADVKSVTAILNKVLAAKSEDHSEDCDCEECEKEKDSKLDKKMGKALNDAWLDSEKLINKLVAVDAKFAVSAGGLAEAIKRVGSVASDAGLGIDDLIASITSAQQTTARGEAVIGNALKTIFTISKEESEIWTCPHCEKQIQEKSLSGWDEVNRASEHSCGGWVIHPQLSESEKAFQKQLSDCGELAKFVEDSNKISQTSSAESILTVIKDKKPKFMLTSIVDITDEFLKTAQATEIREFLEKCASESATKAAEQLKVAELEKGSVAVELENAKKELELAKTELEKLNQEKSLAAAQELFNKRMGYFDEKFDLCEDAKKAIVARVKDIKDDEAFAGYQKEMDIFLKNSEKGKKEIVASVTVINDDKAVSDALKNAEAQKIEVTSGTVKSEPKTLFDKYRKAFELNKENFKSN